MHGNRFFVLIEREEKKGTKKFVRENTNHDYFVRMV